MSVAEARIEEIKAKLDELRAAAPSPKVNVQIAEAERDLNKVTGQLEKLNQQRASVNVDADIAAASAHLSEVQSKLDEVNRLRAQPKVDADTTVAKQRLSELDSRLQALSSKKASPEVELQIAQAQQQALRIRAELDRLGSMRPTAQVDADIALASAQLARINQQLSAIDGKRVNANVSASGNASLILAGIVAALGAVAAAAPAAIAALAAVGGAAGALGQGVAAGLAGFTGIGDALKALEADEKSAATSSASSSNTRANAAKQVASAQSALGQAQTQADRAAITGAQQVASAQQALGQARQQQARTAIQSSQRIEDAERSLGQTVASVAQRVQSAERSVENAQRARQFAQEALTEAVKDAARANRDLQLSVAGAGLSEERAALSLAQARQRLAENKSADPLETADLALSVREAEQNLKEVQTRYGDLKAEQADWARTGVSGSKQVVSATRALQDAQRGVDDSQRSLTEAQTSGAQQIAEAQRAVGRATQEAAWANADAAQQVTQAQQGVAEAVQSASWSQQDAARQVADAQRALAEAYTSGGESAAAGAKQAEYALSKLTPAGRSLVTFLKNEFQPAWKRVTDSVANEMLPRVETALRNSLKLEPTITAGLTEAGRVLGDLAVRGSELATSPPFMASFSSIMASNNRALSDYGNAGINLFGAFTDLYAVAGPVAERFSRLAEYSTQAFESWVIGARQSGELDRYLQSAADTLQYLGGWLMDVGGDVIQFTMSFAPLGAALLEGVRYATDFISTVASWSPTLTSIVGGLGLAAIAMSKLGNATKALSVAGAAGGIGGLAASVRTLLTPSLLAATGPMVALGASGATAGGKLGEMAGKVTGSTTAIATGAAAGAKFTGVLASTASAAPLVGTAILAVALAHDALTTSSSEAAEALLKGGSAAASMNAELARNDATMARNRSWMPGWLADLEEWNRGTFGLQTTTQQANEELEKQISTMSPLEAAQARVTLAQNDYEAALRESGPTSQRTRDAQAALADATGTVAREQDNARRATMTATQALQDQQTKILSAIDARLGEQSAVQATKDAQKALGDAIAQSGPQSDEAAAAQLRLEQAQSSQAQAAVRAATEEAKRRGETDTSRAATDALGRSIGQMVASTQGQLSPALQQMVQGLDAAGLSAAGATVKVDETGRAIATFPNGKTVVLDANTSPALTGLDGVLLKLNTVPGSRQITVATLSAEAEAKLAAIGFTVTHLPNGQVQITANDAWARGTLIAFQQFAAWQVANPQLAADPARAYEAMRGFLLNAGQQTGVPMLDANPQRADQQVRDAVGRYNTTWSTMPVTANPAEADRLAREAHDRASAPANFNVGANYQWAERAGEGFWDRQWRQLNDLGNSLTNFFIGNGFQPNTGRAAGGLIQGLARGGAVAPAGALRGYARGAGGSNRIAASDTVPAMLTPGEFVVRKRAVDRVGLPALEAINGMALGGVVGFAAGGAAKTQPMSAGSSSSAAADVAVPVGDPSATGAAASATSALASSMASAAGQAAVLQPALTALAATQAGVLAPATAAVTAGQQALVTGGILPLVGTMLGSLFPTLGVYQQQMGVAAPAANTALQTSQLATQAQTTATALNTAVNSGLMNAAVTGMSLTGQAQHAALRGTQMMTQASNAQTATSTAVNSQNMAISTTNMSLIGQQQHGNLRLSHGLTQASNNTTALNTATNNANMTATTSGMSTAVQTYLSAVRGGQGLLNQATLAMADWWRAQLGRTLPDAANPLRAVITGPFNRGIIAAWNTLDAQFALGKRVPDVVPGFATGGVYPGYTPGRDIGYAAVSGGEAIMRPEWTRAVGHGYVDAANAAARAGGVKGVSSFLSMAPSPSSGSDEGRAKLKLMDRFTGLDGPPGPVVGHFAPGGVQPHVARASDEVESRLGRMPGGVGGLGARANASDHPSGHALDFMTLRNMPLGDRVAGYLSANSQRLLVKYLIWKQQINQGSGWKPMEDRGNPTANHMDHVHASFLRWGQVGSPFAGGGMFDPAALVEEAFKDTYRQIGAMRAQFPSAHAGRGLDVAQRAADGAKAAAIKKMNEMMTFADPGGAGVERWRPMVLQALARVGQPAAHANITLRRMNQESGGNPRAINNWDSNAAKGIPSKGLMQVIDPTFQRYRDPALSPDIWDPLANTVASMRYALGRYGNLPAAYNRAGGYDNGGLLGTGMTLAYNGTGAPERVLDNVETRNYDTLTRLMGRGGVKVDSPAYGGAQQGAVIHVHPREMQSEQKIALGVKREFDWESRLA